jgi:hypothetical protein
MGAATLPAVARLDVKLFAADPAAVELEGFIKVFHGWIRRGAVPGLLIDVADYAHVHHGPGVMLIGHEVDYALDLVDGRPGLLCQLKRGGEGDLRARLRWALAAAVRAAAEAEDDPDAGGIRFRTDELQVRLLDRLAVPDEEGALEALRPDLEAALEDASAGASPSVERIGEPGDPFTVRVRIPGAPSLAELARRLGDSGA